MDLTSQEDLDRMAERLAPLASSIRLKLLRYLTEPHYLEEVATHLRITRQGARKHLDKLVAIGVLERRSGVRDSGPVTEYVVNPQALFVIYDEFEKLGSLRSAGRGDLLLRTIEDSGRAASAIPAPTPCFWIVRGLGTGRHVPLAGLERKAFLVGRDPRAGLPVDHDPYASNRHAELRRENGRIVLTDLHSTNGTYHNWRLVPRGSDVALRHGDVVGVGKTLLLFWDAA